MKRTSSLQAVRKSLVRKGSNTGFFRQLDDEEQKETVGVCLSGGGPRSAFFCSGVFQSILAKGLPIDYFSTVSGGGYIGSSYMDWKFRNAGKDDPSWHEKYFEHCLQGMHGQSPRFDESLWLGMKDTLHFLGMGVYLIFVLGFLAMFSLLYTLIILHVKVVGPGILAVYGNRSEADYGSTVPWLVLIAFACWLLTILGNHLKLGLLGRDSSLRLYVLQSLLRTLVFNVITLVVVGFLTEGEQLSMLVYDVAVQSSLSTSLCYIIFLMVYLLPFMIIRLIMVFATGDDSRKQIVLTYLIVFAWLVKREVFTDAEERWDTLRLIMFVATAFNPILAPYQQNIFFLFYRNYIRSAFYHPDGNFKTSLSEKVRPFAEDFSANARYRSSEARKCRANGDAVGCLLPYEHCNDWKGVELTFGDLRGMKPEWICHFTANKWTYDSKDPRDLPYKLLTISNELVDIIDYREADHSKYLDLQPDDVSLSTATTMSGAALATFSGSVQMAIHNAREVMLFLGVRFDMNIPSWFDQKEKNTGLGSFLMKAIIAGGILPVLASAAAFGSMFFPDMMLPDCLIFVVYFFMLWSFFFMTFFPSTKGFMNTSDRLANMASKAARMFLTFSLLPLLVREVVHDVTEGDFPDFTVLLSDGGHTENLGLLALLKRRASRIIVSDASAYPTNDMSTELSSVMTYARTWLGCRFSCSAGQDIDEAMLRNFGAFTDRKSPHAFTFQVEYFDFDEDLQVEVVGTGEILVVQPRHPKNYVPGPCSGPLNEDWTAEYADTLNGMFGRMFHNRFPWLFNAFHGPFPQYIAFTMYPSPQMCEALVAEGKRAMLAPVAQAFLDDGLRASRFNERYGSWTKVSKDGSVSDAPPLLSSQHSEYSRDTHMCATVHEEKEEEE